MLADYKCNDCGNVQEELVKYSKIDSFQFHCNSCGSTEGQRQLSVPAVISMGEAASLFKGGLMTSMDTLNGRPKKKKLISNQFRNTTPE
jgi:putative FmdB family regulatory protein